MAVSLESHCAYLTGGRVNFGKVRRDNRKIISGGKNGTEFFMK